MRELWRSRERIIGFGILALVLAVTMPPLVQSFCPTADPLDTSWAWMLGYSLQHHLQWGESVVFTYGPLGFLDQTYFYSDHLLWGLAATVRLTSWILLGLGFACVVGRLDPGGNRSKWMAVPVAAGWIVGATFLSLSAQVAILGVALLLLAIAEEDGAAIVIELALAGFLLAFGALIKSTALIVSLFALLAYPALRWHAGGRRSATRLSLMPLLSFFASFCALWSLSSQSFGHLPAYFRGTWSIVSGYTIAMSVTGMRLQVQSALAILALFAVVLVGLQVAGRKVRVAQWLLLGGLAFFAWKEGFTLQDPGYVRHPMSFYGTALLIASIGTVLLPPDVPRYLKTCLYGAYGVALLSSILGYPKLSPPYAHELDNYGSYLRLVSSRSHRVAEERDQTLAIQRQFDVPDGVLNAVGKASMNVLPWSLVMAQGYGMRLLASPVIQTYSVYTPYLDQSNARQIWDGRSADKIIYTYASLGFRYPPFDEPATFRAIIACYRTEYPAAKYAVLSRVACQPPKMLAVDKTQEATMGNWILVPRQASYVGIDMHASLLGRLKNLLYKADHVYILLGLANGGVAGPFELTYPVARDGLFIRYFVGAQADMAPLFSGTAPALLRIAAIQIVTAPGSRDYVRHFAVRFLQVDSSSRSSSSGPMNLR